MQIKWYHIAALCVLFFFGGYFHRKGDVNTVRVVETINDTITKVVTIDSIVYRDVEILIPQDVDTAAVIEDYFTSRSFDTIIHQNEVKIKFTGSLFENNLQDVRFSVQNTRPTQIVKEMKWGFYVGGVIGNGIAAPTIDAQYDKHMMGVGYNLIGGGLTFSYKYKLWEN